MEKIDAADDEDDAEDVDGIEDIDSGVDTVDSVAPLSPRACSGSGVESTVNFLHVLSGSVPNKLCCSAVRYAEELSIIASV